MGSLRAGKRSNWVGLNRCRWFSQSDIDMLVTKKFHQLAPMGASLPISKDAPDEKPMEVKGPLGAGGDSLEIGTQEPRSLPALRGVEGTNCEETRDSDR